MYSDFTKVKNWIAKENQVVREITSGTRSALPDDILTHGYGSQEETNF